MGSALGLPIVRLGSFSQVKSALTGSFSVLGDLRVLGLYRRIVLERIGGGSALHAKDGDGFFDRNEATMFDEISEHGLAAALISCRPLQ